MVFSLDPQINEQIEIATRLQRFSLVKLRKNKNSSNFLENSLNFYNYLVKSLYRDNLLKNCIVEYQNERLSGLKQFALTAEAVKLTFYQRIYQYALKSSDPWFPLTMKIVDNQLTQFRNIANYRVAQSLKELKKIPTSSEKSTKDFCENLQHEVRLYQGISSLSTTASLNLV